VGEKRRKKEMTEEKNRINLESEKFSKASSAEAVAGGRIEGRIGGRIRGRIGGRIGGGNLRKDNGWIFAFFDSVLKPLKSLKTSKPLRTITPLILVLFFIFLIGGASFIYVYNSNPSSEAFFFNRTSILNGTGLGLDAPVLFMDFNSAPENNTDGNVTYVKDNSVYNNGGTLQP
jgi:hypothetical protein